MCPTRERKSLHYSIDADLISPRNLSPSPIPYLDSPPLLFRRRISSLSLSPLGLTGLIWRRERDAISKQRRLTRWEMPARENRSTMTYIMRPFLLLLEGEEERENVRANFLTASADRLHFKKLRLGTDSLLDPARRYRNEFSERERETPSSSS